VSDSSPPIIPESHRDLLEGIGIAHMATIGPSGAPQVNPVGYLWDDSRLVLVTSPTSQKVRNLRRDPRIALSIIDAARPDRYLEVRGVLERVDPDPEQRLFGKFWEKYGQFTTGTAAADEYREALRAGERVILVVAPQSVTHLG
jgi:PPOX class probable F420-dependent enzyme